MHIVIVCIGKLKEAGLRPLQTLYCKRLSHHQVELIELPDGKASDPEKRLREEAGKIGKIMKGGGLWVLLDEKGREYTSRRFANWISGHQMNAVKTLGFILGSSHGVSEELKKNISQKIRLSSFTFTHEMARIIFLEQLYRAFCIIRGVPYHH